MLILAFLLAAYLVAPIDDATLRATRFVIGAIGSATTHAPTPSRAARSAPSASPTRSGRSRATRSAPPAPAPRSRIAAGIRGGIRSADRAESRRGDRRAAIGVWRTQTRQRLHDARVRRAEDQAHDENDRRDRAAERARIRGGVQQIAEQIDPAPEPDQPEPAPAEKPAGDWWARIDQPNGDPMDVTTIPLTELDTLDQLQAELGAARQRAAEAYRAVNDLSQYLTNLQERYTAATDLWKTGQMDANVALLGERNLNAVDFEIDRVNEQLAQFINAVDTAKKDVTESDARTGRVESARAS